MRKIEQKIINTIQDLKNNTTPEIEQKTIFLSLRDRIITNGNCISYYLWNTCIYCHDSINNESFFNPSSVGSGDSAIISNTTKSRLNAILSTFHGLHLSQKNYELFCNGKKIKPDTKYSINYDSTFEEIK